MMFFYLSKKVSFLGDPPSRHLRYCGRRCPHLPGTADDWLFWLLLHLSVTYIFKWFSEPDSTWPSQQLFFLGVFHIPVPPKRFWVTERDHQSLVGFSSATC